MGCRVRILTDDEFREKYPDIDPAFIFSINGVDIDPDMVECFGREGIVEQYDPNDGTAQIDCAIGWWPEELLTFISGPDSSLFFGFQAGDIVEMKSVDEMQSDFRLEEIWFVSNINDRLIAGDVVGAIEQCVASAKSLNIGEGATMEYFLRDLFQTSKKIIELPDHTSVSPSEALKWLNDHEAKQKEEGTENGETD